MKKPVAVLVILIFLSGCASQANYGHGNAISTVKTQSGGINAPHLSNYTGQPAHGNYHHHAPPVYYHTPYYPVNNTHDLVGFIFLMVFCAVLNDGDC
jgi:hypothetical protein